MTEVVLKINPFSILQKGYTKTPNTIETYDIELDKITDFLLNLPDDSRVLMVGNKQYISKYIKQYREIEQTKFEKKRHLNIIYASDKGSEK